ncbi:MAG: hypothetical protein DRI95_12790 [Bacteroidetes bacterium]|nr:MAG: hypothetical protein DRI95_12790 [Bacteroidota bacterium]
MNIKTPLLSIVLPNYNSWPYIQEAVSSLLNQTFSDFVLIIVDDSSTDQSINYLQSLKDTRIILLTKEHSGIIDTFNYALPYVKSKYTARVDADDYYFPEKFEKQIERLEEEKNIIALGTQGYYMSSKGVISKMRIKVPVYNDEIINDFFEKKRGVLQPSIVMRTDILKKLNGYRKNILPEDYDLYFRLGLIGKLENLQEYLYAYRYHNSFNQKNLLYLASNLDILISHYAPKYKVQPSRRAIKRENKSIYYNRKALFNYLEGYKTVALFYIFMSIVVYPKKIIQFIKNNILQI